MDVDARIQLFDLKSSYEFVTQPGVDRYNMPLYDVQTEPGSQSIEMFPVYQGFVDPVFINGVPIKLQTQKNLFFNIWPNIAQNMGVLATGDGTAGPYTLQFPLLGGTTPPNPPYQSLVRGHVDMTGIIATGLNIDPPSTNGASLPGVLQLIPTTSISPAIIFTTQDSSGANVIVQDSGILLQNEAYNGMLISPGTAPFGHQALSGTYSSSSNTINYLTGTAYVTFPVAIPSGTNIFGNATFYQTGLPREILFYNNTLTLRTVPDRAYLVSLDAYLTPAAFLSTGQAIPFGYMAEYIARGAARKILSDTGDVEQFQFYEPLFIEQERLVWKRSQRQWTATRTETIYSQGAPSGGFFNVSSGGGFA